MELFWRAVNLALCPNPSGGCPKVSQKECARSAALHLPDGARLLQVGPGIVYGSGCRVQKAQGVF